MEFLNYISAFLTSIVTAIGLYFIWKQIKIAKNKSLVIDIHNDMKKLFKKTDEIVQQRIANVKQYIIKLDYNTFDLYHKTKKQCQHQYNAEILEHTLNHLRNKIRQNLADSYFTSEAEKIMVDYDWWLPKNNLKETCFNSEIMPDSSNFISCITIDKLMNSFNDSYISLDGKTKEIKNFLLKKLDVYEEEYKNNYVEKRKIFNEFLAKLSKNSL